MVWCCFPLASLYFVTFPLVWFRYVGFCYVRLLTFLSRQFTFFTLRYISLSCVSLPFPLRHLPLTIPPFLVSPHLPNLVLATHISSFLLHSFQSHTAHIVIVCCVFISTDELLRSLRVSALALVQGNIKG